MSGSTGRPKLVIAIADRQFPRVAALADGRVRLDGWDTEFVTLRTGENVILKQAFEDPAFNVVELSLARYAMWHAEGGCPYIALPVFISRSFRHGDIYLAPGSRITQPHELRHRRVGTGDYRHTGHIWARHLLAQDYGVEAEEITWVFGHRERAAAGPEDFHIPGTPIPTEVHAGATSLSDALVLGEIDALLSPIPPSSFLRPESGVQRLFRAPETEAARNFRRHGIFPILHVVGLRTDLAREFPELPGLLTDALTRAKDLWVDDAQHGEGWLSDLLGRDICPYGLGPDNLRALSCFLDRAHAEGLIGRRLRPEELFAPVPG